MDIVLPAFFSDGMVLQRGEKIKLWGTAKPGKNVRVFFINKEYNGSTDIEGNWCIVLDRHNAGGPYDMRILSDNSEIVVRDILIGDVWLCGGQSNMELMINRVKNMYPDDIDLDYPEIRQFKVPQEYNFHAPSEKLSGGNWERYSPHTAESFTAVGYFFAKKLYDKYCVPIGLLTAAVGGTPIKAWLGRDALCEFPELLEEADKFADDEYIERLASDYSSYSAEYFKNLGERDEGFRFGWNSADFDDADWDETSLCDETGGLGVYWYRKTVNVPESLCGKPATLFFGTAIDSFDVYINGEKIGGTPYRYPPCECNFTLPSGRMLVALRLSCFGQKGGFISGKNRFIACGNNSLRLDGMWKRRKGAGCEPFQGETFVKYMATGLYNGMIAPLTHFPLKGVIWYQGESDAGNADSYAEKFKLLINEWRKAWNIGDFPFIFVEIAHWGEAYEPDWDALRSKQRKALELPNTGMAAAFDLGEANDLHPQNKRDVGERLARLAMRIAYGETLPHSCFETCSFAID